MATHSQPGLETDHPVSGQSKLCILDIRNQLDVDSWMLTTQGDTYHDRAHSRKSADSSSNHVLHRARPALPSSILCLAPERWENKHSWRSCLSLTASKTPSFPFLRLVPCTQRPAPGYGYSVGAAFLEPSNKVPHSPPSSTTVPFLPSSHRVSLCSDYLTCVNIWTSLGRKTNSRTTHAGIVLAFG
jgi:hypothetical protein